MYKINENYEKHENIIEIKKKRVYNIMKYTENYLIKAKYMNIFI